MSPDLGHPGRPPGAGPRAEVQQWLPERAVPGAAGPLAAVAVPVALPAEPVAVLPVPDGGAW